MIHRVTGVEALNAMAIFIPCFADAKVLGIWLGMGQTWARGGKLRDIAVYEFHLERPEVLRIGHLVGMLDDEIGV